MYRLRIEHGKVTQLSSLPDSTPMLYLDLALSFAEDFRVDVGTVVISKGYQDEEGRLGVPFWKISLDLNDPYRFRKD